MVLYLGFLMVINFENVFMCICNSLFVLDFFSIDSIVFIVVEEVCLGLLDSFVWIEILINIKFKLCNIMKIYERILFGDKNVMILIIFIEWCFKGIYSIYRGIWRRFSDKYVNCYFCLVGGNCFLFFVV